MTPSLTGLAALVAKWRESERAMAETANELETKGNDNLSAYVGGKARTIHQCADELAPIATETAAELQRLKAVIAAGRELQAELVDALVPFADLADAYDDEFGTADDTGMATAVGSISPAELRQARALLRKHGRQG